MKATILKHPARTSNTSQPLEDGGSSGFIQPTLIKKKELAKRLSVSTRSIDTWVGPAVGEMGVAFTNRRPGLTLRTRRQ